MKTIIKSDNLKMEKKAIFEASLKLLSEGKFYASSLAEIAFQANLSGTMILYVFESRETLLQEMSESLTKQIVNTLEDAGKYSLDFKERFFDSWMALYRFYTICPHVIAFIEQFENLKSLPHPEKIIHPAKSNPLLELFNNEEIREMDSYPNAEMLAVIFHANALTAAKIKSNTQFNSTSTPEDLVEILWNGLNVQVKKTRRFML